MAFVANKRILKSYHGPIGSQCNCFLVYEDTLVYFGGPYINHTALLCFVFFPAMILVDGDPVLYTNLFLIGFHCGSHQKTVAEVQAYGLVSY